MVSLAEAPVGSPHALTPPPPLLFLLSISASWPLRVAPSRAILVGSGCSLHAPRREGQQVSQPLMWAPPCRIRLPSRLSFIFCSFQWEDLRLFYWIYHECQMYSGTAVNCYLCKNFVSCLALAYRGQIGSCPWLCVQQCANPTE